MMSHFSPRWLSVNFEATSGMCSLPLKLIPMADPPKEVNATTLTAQHVLGAVFSLP